MTISLIKPKFTTSELRSIIREVPKEIRNLARRERQDLCRMEAQYPGSYSYAMAKGTCVENAKLQSFLSEIYSREAQREYMKHLR